MAYLLKVGFKEVSYLNVIMYLVVDMSGTNIKKIDRVQTWLNCRWNCWTVAGSNNAYRDPETPNQFKVYLTQRVGSDLTTNVADRNDFVLYYEVEGPCS